MLRHPLAADADAWLDAPELAKDAAAPMPAFPLAAVAELPTHRPRVLSGAIIASCAMHAAAAVALLASATTALPEFGVLDRPSDTFSLAMTQTIVLESIVTEAQEMTAAASAAMPEGTVQSVDAEPEPLKAEDAPIETQPPPSPVKAAEVDPEMTEQAEEPLEVLRGAAEPDDAVEVRAAAAEQQEIEAVIDDKARSRKRRELAERQRSQRQVAGGPSARANAATAAASGRVSASRGSILSYGARVRAKVAHNKPSSRGEHGVAKVSFAIAPTGELAYARLAHSSGNAALDAAALAAVRRSAPFGAPPPEAAPDDLHFSIRITYR